MIKEIEELIKIVGKGNLLEAIFIRKGSFQHADLDRCIDYRNHFGLSAFIRKKDELLDKYFNLKFSLQGLFLIYTQAYSILIENTQLSSIRKVKLCLTKIMILRKKCLIMLKRY